jgi:hypothetical protein
MKFLVFNIIVLFSLGYLLTSKPNENFSDWASDKKNKISNLSKDQIVSTIKKATGESKVVRDFTENQVNKDTLKNDTNEINTSIVSDIREKVNKDSDLKNENLKTIINDILEEKNKNKLEQNKEIIDEKPEVHNNEIASKEFKKENPQNKFMSLEERENSLAELIVDMELYHLMSLKK